MNTTQLEAVQSPLAITPEMLPAHNGQTSPLPEPLLEEAQVGSKELRKMPHEEPHGAIAQRVALLKGILRYR